jgi:hypothetical protein
MVESVASGIVYSHHPFHFLEDNIIITAVWGLGPYSVGGVITKLALWLVEDCGIPLAEAGRQSGVSTSAVSKIIRRRKSNST